MAIEEEPPASVPIWMLTFGDMMALMLTFFVMLLSVTEMKSQEKFHALAASMRSQFGHDAPALGFRAGWAKPRDSKIAVLTAVGRARKISPLGAGHQVLTTAALNHPPSVDRSNSHSVARATLEFTAGSAELSEPMRHKLQNFAIDLSGKNATIDIRGRTSLQPDATNSGSADPWQMAYDRCRKTMQYLVEDLQIDSQRVRLSVAGPGEPPQLENDAVQRPPQNRVEIYLLDEVVPDLTGKPAILEPRSRDGQE